MEVVYIHLFQGLIDTGAVFSHQQNESLNCCGKIASLYDEKVTVGNHDFVDVWTSISVLFCALGEQGCIQQFSSRSNEEKDSTVVDGMTFLFSKVQTPQNSSHKADA